MASLSNASCPRPVLRQFFLISVLATLLAPGLADAKRTPPAAVAPVLAGGVRYVAPNDDGRRGYVQAWDTHTGKLVWEVTVYTNAINPDLEEDVQWVFIKQLRLAEGKLRVMDERDQAYSVDLQSRAVKKLKPAPPEKPPAGTVRIASGRWGSAPS